jgi:OOP family OmpA-OmpF porin
MTQKWLVSILGAAALAVSGGTLAQTSTGPAVPSFYVGAEVGSADVGDDDDIGYKILGGYQFHRNLSAEVAYGLLFDKSDVEVTGLELVAVGLWPLGNNFNILGKLGFVNWEVDSPVGSDDGTDITWAVGVQFDMSRNLALRAAWQRYETDPDETDFLNVGVIWKF